MLADNNITIEATVTSADIGDSSVDKYTRTSVSSGSRSGGGRVIKIKRKKVPANKEMADDAPTAQLEKSVSEPEAVPEPPQVEGAQLAV